jgi:hypothetical protein
MEVLDPETGELDDVDELMNLPLERLVRRRHDAHEQERGWKAEQAKCDAALLARMESKQAVVDDLLCRLNGPRISLETDVAAFVDDLVTIEVGRLDLLDTLRAAKAFDRERLPESLENNGAVRALFDKWSAERFSRMWITTAVVLRRAPK